MYYSMIVLIIKQIMLIWAWYEEKMSCSKLYESRNADADITNRMCDVPNKKQYFLFACSIFAVILVCAAACLSFSRTGNIWE